MAVASRLAALGVAAAVFGAPARAQPLPAVTAIDGQRAFEAGDFVRARAIWEALAPAGDDVAALGLAAMLDQGAGTPPDQAGALRWYRVAAGHGVPEAEFDVAVMLDSGRGIKRDVAEAAIWYARAAARGQRRAQYNLGQLYAGGEGVPRNPDVARAWYEAAASNGVSAAATKLFPPPKAMVAAPKGPVQLSPVVPQVPADGQSEPSGGSLEFVWAAPPQPVPVTFFVEVAAVTEDGPRPAAARYVAESATTIDVGGTPGAYAWRVYVVDQRRQHYAVGEWRRFSVEAARPAGD